MPLEDGSNGPGSHPSIAGESVVVTGGGGLIGNAIVDRLVELGGRVIAVDRSVTGPSGATATHIERLQADITDDDDVERILEAVLDSGCRLIVHAAGWQLPDGRQRMAGGGEWESLFKVHVIAPTLITTRLFDGAHSRGRTASCVFISSVHEKTVFGDPSYGAVKGALKNAVSELAARAADRGSRVNSVAPGHVDGSGVSSPPSRLGRRAISPQAVARAVAFLLCDHCSPYTTGATLLIDAGMRLRDPWEAPTNRKKGFPLRWSR